MMAYRSLGGASVPPFYGEQVLPLYASIIPIDLVHNQPRDKPIVTWSGWHQYLLQKILAEPSATYQHLVRVCVALGLPFNLNREDFPMASLPSAQVKENLFLTQIYALAQKGISAGAFGGGRFGGGGGFGGAGGAGGGHHSSGTGKLAAKVGLNILNASFGGGAGGGGSGGQSPFFPY